MRHTIRAPAALAVLAALGAAVVGGCGGATAVVPASPSPSAPLPASADITGTVSDLSGGRGSDTPPVLLVMSDPETGSSLDRASVRVTEDTVVWASDGRRGAASDVTEGERIAAWFSGPVAESYPVQATAGVVQIQLPD